jgi:hypothetical protein
MRVDSARFLSTIRRLRTGLGLRNHLSCGPSFSLLRADLLPQPPAGVRTCRDRLRLCLRSPAGGCSRGRRRADADSPWPNRRSEADRRRARGRDRRQRGWGALSMGRLLARRRLRLLRARLLGLQAAGNSTPTQLVRALRPGQAHSPFQDEARRLALLFRTGTRRHLHWPGAHGARTAHRHPGPSRQAGTLVLRGATCRRSSRHPHLVRLTRRRMVYEPGSATLHVPRPNVEA